MSVKQGQHFHRSEAINKKFMEVHKRVGGGTGGENDQKSQYKPMIKRAFTPKAIVSVEKGF